ncbi:CHAD domain-containing protein [Pseudoxanthomonas sp. 10H]|uniref:CHAD domain-containing protein n=1 Tax=Pseudoxanthomonas sp. 10H TaxID=3242729 RepID=UPI003555F33D
MPSPPPGSRLGHLLQRECLAAVEALATADRDAHAGVHEARKAIRRARSLLALVARELDVQAADRILRRAGASLGALRDARAVALTADRLARPRDDATWSLAAATLQARADRLARRELAVDPRFARRRRAIQRAARLLRDLPWADVRSADIRTGVVRQARRAERAGRRADRHPDPDNLHRWRRRVRRLRMQVDALDALRIDVPAHDPGASRRLHRLSDALGARQDLAVLEETLRRLRALDGRRELLAQLQAQPRST